MNKSILVSTILVLVCGVFQQCKLTAQPAQLTKIVKFASVKEGQEALTKADDFTNSWSQFDMDARAQKSDATKEDVFELIRSNVLEWTSEEKKQISAVFAEVEAIILKEQYTLPLPNEILVIKTSMKEEGNASGYTRGNNIILGEKAIAQNPESLKHLVIHELFHVLSRNDKDFKTAMYDIIGFTTTNQIALPDSIADKKITNPDAPLIDAFITLETNDGAVDCAMILYATEPWKGGSFFEYINIAFLKLEGELNKIPYLEDGAPVFYTMGEALNFFDQVGMNTNYIIHPEEILADNFTSLILQENNLADPWIIDEIRHYLID